MSVDLYSRSLISHINGLKSHVQACSAFSVLQAILDFVLNSSPIPHLWPRKLGPFQKRAARPSLIIASLSNFKRRRKNRRVGY